MNTAELVLQWQNYRVAVPIKVNEYEKILASIDQELSGSSSFDYFQAALYLLIPNILSLSGIHIWRGTYILFLRNWKH